MDPLSFASIINADDIFSSLLFVLLHVATERRTQQTDNGDKAVEIYYSENSDCIIKRDVAHIPLVWRFITIRLYSDGDLCKLRLLFSSHHLNDVQPDELNEQRRIIVVAKMTVVTIFHIDAASPIKRCFRITIAIIIWRYAEIHTFVLLIKRGYDTLLFWFSSFANWWSGKWHEHVSHVKSTCLDAFPFITAAVCGRKIEGLWPRNGL